MRVRGVGYSEAGMSLPGPRISSTSLTLMPVFTFSAFSLVTLAGSGVGSAVAMEVPRMRRFGTAVGGLPLAPLPAFAQQNLRPLPQPRPQTISPAGARAGTSVEVSFAATHLDEPEALHFSHPGLKAEPVEPPA